ncbi:MAG: glycosyltransferase [Anaerolineaceae bacterium]
MKKILAISWAFPPVILPRSLQVSRTLKSLLNSGWQASVLCVDPRSIQRAFKSDPLLGAEYQGLFEVTAVPSPEDSVAVRAIWKVFPNLSLMPDPRSVWIPAAIFAARSLLSNGGFSGILSFAQPWSDHMIARQLSKDFQLPWIAHFSDPWTDSPYYRLKNFYANIRLKMERSVIRDADAVIFVSEETRSLVMKKYPVDWAARAHVIPHCFEPLAIQTVIESKTNGPLRLVYTGGFYGHRTPVNLFKSLAKINRERRMDGRLAIEFVGPGSDIYANLVAELGLEKIVKLTPMVPYQESQKIAAQADVLLVIDAPSEGVNVFLPSKLVEYLAFRKPILGITPLKGATANLLRCLECPLVDTEDVDGISTVLTDLMQKKEKGSLAVSPAFVANAARYDITETTRQYVQLLNALFLKDSSD